MRKKQKSPTEAVILGIFILVVYVALVIAGSYYRQPVSIISPIVVSAHEEITPTPTPTVVPSPTPTATPLQIQIELEIKEVFGEHADKAFLLLKGKGIENDCRENKSLDPKAINRNWIEGQPGKYDSSDYGIFQINDKWQGITHAGKAKQFLLDWKINIRIAWRLYEDDNYSFKLWTCGRHWGI